MVKKGSKKKVVKRAGVAASVAHRDVLSKEIIKGSEGDYDKLFEKKLAEQYRAFRSLREHRLQIRKLIRVLIVLVIIGVLALLLLSFG